MTRLSVPLKEVSGRRLMRTFLPVLCVCLLNVPAFAAEVDPGSRIGDVVIYPGTARITRELKANLSEGMHTIHFSDIKPVIDDNSLTVSGSGTAKVKIYGAKTVTRYLTENADARVKELEKKLEGLNDLVMTEQSRLSVLQSKRQFVESVKLFAGTQLPKDLVTTMPSAENLSQTLDFVGTSLSGIDTEQQKAGLAIRELMKDINQVKQELNQIRSSAGSSIRSIAVETECEKAGDLTLSVSYNVGSVGWYPVYDARVDFNTGKANLLFSAMTRQSSGEDWDDARLSISTARPSLGGTMPELSPWYLQPYQTERRKGRDMAPQMLMKSVVMSDEAFEMDASGMDKPQEAEMVYAQAQDTGTAVVYNISKPVTIKADGSEQRVPVSAQALNAVFEYATTPKLSPFAYLKAVVTNGQEERLLPGQINIFLDGNFVGKSQLNKTIAANEAFDLYLGVDEGVSVKRELIENRTDDTLIGNVPSPNRNTIQTYKITVENYKKKDIKLSVFDQIPVPQDDKIKVRDIKYSQRPSQENYRDRKGVVVWELNLKPAEKKEITCTFTVEHPRGLNVNGL